jgi:predicted  nucleic acid-binding Zn-ribbon protein
MKSLKNSKTIMICAVLMAMAFMVSGCATCGQVKRLETQVDEISLKADNAMAAAAAAQKKAEECCATAGNSAAASNKAAAAADRAAAAADRAENAAAKAEAVFMKRMNK